MGKVVGKPVEIEIPVSFMFSIEDVPKPAYLHLVNGKVIRADEVREFTNGIEYTIGQHTHRISADSVTDVNGCARVVLRPPQRQGDCLPSGGPSFDIRAIPLLPSETASVAQEQQPHRISLYSAVIDVDEANLDSIRDLLVMDNSFMAETQLTEKWEPLRAVASENVDRLKEARQYLHTLWGAVDSRYVVQMKPEEVKTYFKSLIPQNTAAKPAEAIFDQIMQEVTGR